MATPVVSLTCALVFYGSFLSPSNISKFCWTPENLSINNGKKLPPGLPMNVMRRNDDAMKVLGRYPAFMALGETISNIINSSLNCFLTLAPPNTEDI